MRSFLDASKKASQKGVNKKMEKDKRFLGAAFAVEVVILLQVIGLIYEIFN